MAEIIRTRRVPPQKYGEEGSPGPDVQHPGPETNLVSQRQDMKRAEMEPDEQEEEIPSVVSIGVN
jgi:hypothetical protein